MESILTTEEEQLTYIKFLIYTGDLSTLFEDYKLKGPETLKFLKFKEANTSGTFSTADKRWEALDDALLDQYVAKQLCPTAIAAKFKQTEGTIRSRVEQKHQKYYIMNKWRNYGT